MYTFRVPCYIARHIDAQPNKTDFIKSCIIKAIERQADFSKLGEVISPSEIKCMTLPFFDIDIAAGFPIPLDNDERGQDIDLLRISFSAATAAGSYPPTPTIPE